MRALTAEARHERNGMSIRAGGCTTDGTAADRRASSRACVIRVLLVCSLLMTIAGCSSSPGSLRVFAAAGAKPAVDEAVRRFQHERSDRIEVTYGGGGEVLAKMALARRGDVYVAPEQQFMKNAVEQGVVVPTTIRDIAYMVPVLAVQKDNPKRVAALPDLTRPGMRVAVTRPKTTCLGEYAPQIFERAGLAEAIAKNVVAQAPRPDLLVTWLVLGEVDAVITWHFYGHQARDDVRAIWLPREQLPGIGKMQAAVAAFSENHDLAWSFVDFLASADGRAVFEKHGYIVDSGELARHWRSSGPGPRAETGLASRKPPEDKQTNAEGPEPPLRTILMSNCSLEEICLD